ncbi:hypothetical protein HanPSC8_Chr15g0677711 [Helianthus annuus]|nr:hypothetical protein HanPSC8_Chr15g0677711 [Helianthus annuus]
MGISSSKGRERQGWHPMTAKSTNLLLLLPLFIQWSHSHLITIRQETTKGKGDYMGMH